MSALGSLVVKLALEYAEYTRGLDKGSQEALRFAQNVQRHMDTATGSVKEFATSAATGALGAVAAFASVSAVIDRLTTSINELDALDEMSQRLSLTTRTLQELAYAGKMNGVELDGLATGYKKLAVAQKEAFDGGKEQAAVFKAIGVEVRDASGQLRATEAVFADVANVFADMEDGAGKTALAIKLFGKAGADMVPLLNQGAQGIEDLKTEANELHLILGNGAIKTAADFNDQLDKMHMMSSAAAKSIAAELLPGINSLLKSFIDARKAGLGLMDSIGAMANDSFGGLQGNNTERLLQVDEKIKLLKDMVKASEDHWFVMRPVGADNRMKDLEQLRAFLLQRVRADQADAGHVGDLINDALDEANGKRKTPAPNLNAPDAKTDRTTEAERLIQTLKEQIAVDTAALASTEKLSEGERALAKFEADLREGKDASLSLREREIRALYATRQALDDELEAREAVRKSEEEGRKFTSGLLDKAEAARLEVQLFGLAKSTLDELTAARYEESLALLEQQRATAALSGATADQLEYFDRSIRQVREMAEAQRSLAESGYRKEQLEAGKKAAEETARIWQRTSDEIGQGLTDSLFRAFDAGKDFASTFLDGLKNLFKTTVLRIPFQYVQTGVMNSFGFNNAGGLNNAGGSAGNSVTDWLGYGKNAYQWLTGASGNALGSTGSLNLAYSGDFLSSGIFGAGAGASIYGSGVSGAAYGTNAGLSLYGTGSGLTLSGSSAGLSATAGSAASNLSWINGASGLWGAGAGIAGGMLGGALFNNKGYSSMGGSLGAVGGLAVAGSSAAAASAAGATLGSALPVVGTIAGAVLGAAIGSLFGGGGETRYGAGYNVNAGKASKGGGPSGGDPAAEKVTAAIENTYASMVSLADRFGGSLDGVSGYRAGWEVSPKKGRSFVFAGLGQDNRIDLSGEKDPAKVLEAFQLQLQRSVIQGLQQGNLEKPYQEYLAGIDAQKLSADDVQAVLGTLEGLHQFVDAVKKMPFAGFANLSAAAALELAKVAGGMDALVNGLTNYYQLYYSAEEQQAQARQQLANQFDALNVAMPESKAAFRSLLEGINLNDEGGRKLYATLLGIAPAFAQITDAMEASAEALKVFGKQVTAFQQSLDLSNLSTLTPEQQYQEAKRRYDETSAAARGGDADAQAQWTQIAQAFLEASRAYYASSGQYGIDYATVQGFRPNGSHAGGLAFVPFDGYMAELHQGERVLTRAENALFNQAREGAGAGQAGNAELVAEMKALRAEVRALRGDGQRLGEAGLQQAEDHSKRALEVADRQARALDDFVNNPKR